MQPESPAVAPITRKDHQRRARDLVVIQATLAACQEATKHWFCCPVKLKIDVDSVLRKLP